MKKAISSVLTIWILVIGCLSGLLIVPNNTVSGIEIPGGQITSNDIWDIGNSPYYIQGDVYVENNATLTIEAGVEVIFNGSYGLYIGNGTLKAVGNPPNMIKFTNSNDSFTWTGIQINSTGLATIKFCNITNATNGIYIEQSTGNEIQNCEISNVTNYGIWLSESDKNDISNNSIFSHNFYWRGIFLYSSSGNNIENNTVSGSMWGIRLSLCDNNNITSNRIFSNNDGIYIQTLSHDNNITKNNISMNFNYGIYLTSGDNLIYHNILWFNTYQAYDEDGNNTWNMTYPIGGNYWSDFDEPIEGAYDNYTGHNQDIEGSDGIVDDWYVDIDNVTGKSYDYYPLMGPIEGIGPRIQLIYPLNNSVIQPGVILDFLVYDEDLDIVNYSIDGGIEQTFPEPFDISTSGWIEGLHNVTINATDLSNHSILRIFFFTIDSIKPFISLNSPANNSLIPGGTFLNFSVIDINLDHVNYSVNGGSNVTLPAPYNISTVGWADGGYTVQINAQDEAGNSNSSWYFFTLDSASPIIILNAPANNSIIPAGTILDFSIIEPNLDHVNYSVNGELNISLSDPFDISTSGWADEDYTVQINALDIAGNSTISWFNFTIDSTKPIIQLNSPVNNSIIPAGTILDFSVFDPNLDHVNYSVNAGVDTPLSDPYDISTGVWSDGDYTVQINAQDQAGNSNSSWYSFIIDSTKPTIILNSPFNNSVIPSGTILDFSIIDPNLSQVTYSRNGEPDVLFTDPYDISTSGWADGGYTILINAEDIVGNLNSSLFFFTIDSTKPTIQLNSPVNNSIIPADTLLDFSVSDSNLDHVNYSVNAGVDTPLSDPYDITTSGWTDGVYKVQINAQDTAGNTAFSWYNFTIDSVPPTIILNSPANESIIPSGTSLNFSIDDPHLSQTKYTINFGSEQTLTSPYDIPTTGWADGSYIITIIADDAAGNRYSLSFLFTIDSTKPIIQLNSPENNSIILSGAIIDLSITDPHLMQANYSINGEPNIPLSDPFDISTSGWLDGDYTIQINTVDLVGNSNSSWYFFTVDTTLPQIILNTPENNAVITEGTVLDFSIIDLHLSHVNYSVNGGVNNPLTDPYDIPTTGWSDDVYNIQINTIDEAGNINSSVFSFTIDSTKPQVLLNSPENNSVIPNGTILDFSIDESNFNNTNYSINGGSIISLSDPFDISTAGWADGNYTVQINALDKAGNSNSSWFNFTVDSSKPIIILNTPENNSVIHNSTILNFTISDPHLVHVNYSINGGVNISLLDPFNISIFDLADGDYTVQINAVDMAGNSNSSWYYFTIDSTPPIIIFGSPGNNSIIDEGTVLNFSIIDSNLLHVNYSVNGGVETPLLDPFNISTSGWSDGNYIILINTTDLAGNLNSSWYNITIDDIPPDIILVSPEDNAIINEGTVLDFLIVDENLLQVNYSVNGGANISLSDPFNITTTGWTDDDYIVQINALDMVGNSVSLWFVFTVDSTPPAIVLNSPENNTLIGGGTLLDFSVVDPNLFQANYSVNQGVDIPFSDPFEIPTSGWESGDYTVLINAIDITNNSNSSWFFFTIDSTPPTITIDPDLNHSIISIGKLIQLDITDPDTDAVMYSIDGGEYSTLAPPYIINTSSWSDGRIMVHIKANDTFGNDAIIWFEVYIINESLILLIDEIGDVMDENEVQVGGYPNIDMTNISIWKVGDYLLYEVEVVGAIQDQIVESDIYYYGLYLFMDETDDPENNDDADFTINCILGMVSIENTTSQESQSLEAFGFGNSTLKILIPLSFINDRTDFKIDANSIIYVNFDLISGTYEEAFIDTSLDAIDLLLDTDNDGTPDVEDVDDDNDGHLDDNDAFPLDNTEWIDTDSDEIGNNADADDDGDGYSDVDDAFPLDSTEWLDTDSDGEGNNADTDDDDDGYLDDEDAFPLDASEWLDTDGDGIGNNADTDDDDDGHPDTEDAFPLDSSKWKKADEEPSDGMIWIILVVVAVVIVVIVVLLLIQRKRGKAAEEGLAPEGEVAFGGIVTEGEAPPEGEVGLAEIGEAEQVPPYQPVAFSYKCPHCQNPFSAPIPEQPMVARCPMCGELTTIGPQ
ncbi:MAG: right-handed parallel beta-helix repeat-containing protein [Thermoplasmata archaeon]|nr:MAG: right-handed parallel beta-helix repeat-containing protein [Thermoplasmata archaeon]